jgi:hypothetical protein
MIYIFERIPINQSPPSGFKSSFASAKLNIDDHKKIEQITKSQASFYAFFSRIFSDKNFLPRFDEIESQLAYLWSTIDLLEIGIKSNYSLGQNYAPFLDEQQPIVLDKDKESTMLAEYIFGRVVFALGTIKFLKKPLQTHLKKVFETSLFNSAESQENKKLFKLGFIRLAKLYRNQKLLWVS